MISKLARSVGQPFGSLAHRRAASSMVGLENATALRVPTIMPTWWTGTAAVEAGRYEIDCAPYGLRAETLANGEDLPRELSDRVKATFHDVGLVHLVNTGLGMNQSAMRRCALEALGPNVMAAYTGGANSRAKLGASNGHREDHPEMVEDVFATGAPGVSHIHYHHEMAYVSKSVRGVAFCCSRAPLKDGTYKGATFVSEAVGHTDALMRTTTGQKMKELGITYIRNLTDRDQGGCDNPHNEEGLIYNHWQTSFGTDDPEEAEAIALSRGLEIAWGPNRFLKTKYTTSAFEYFPQLDRNLLYSSVADDSIWFDTWPGVRKLPTMESFEKAKATDRPLKITYGDGTDLTREDLANWVRVYDEHGLPLDYQPGDVAVHCNHRWAHGRPAFTLGQGEHRTIGVVLGEMYERQGQRDDSW